MRVTYKILNEYVDLQGIEPQEIKERLTFAGVEVESMIPQACGTNLVIGQILTCEKVEGSDHLHLCSVDVGGDTPLSIICGAPNARVGLKVIVALVGAKLAGNLEIKKSKIRGVESNGMLCSLLELGVDSNSLSDKQKAGIEELPSTAKIGNREVLPYLGLDDVTFELNVLPNRPDILGVYNVARELACLFGVALKPLKITPVKLEDIPFKTEIKTPLADIFSAQVVKNIKVQDSPKWLQEALLKLGIKPINNIVDISNYVMLILCQPIHMYDYDLLPHKGLCIRTGVKQNVTALDEKEYQIIADDIVIATQDTPQCIGGIMGLKTAAINEQTKNIVIEVAHFDPVQIRKTSRRLGIQSESAMRNIHGINPHNHQEVITLIDTLLNEMNESPIFGTVHCVSHLEKVNSPIMMDSHYLNHRLGTHLSGAEIKAILERNGSQVSLKDEQLIVTPPHWRLDLLSKVDLSEEVIRLIGFEALDNELVQVNVPEAGYSRKAQRLNIIRKFLLASQLDEIITYTLIDKKSVDICGVASDSVLRLSHPLSENRQFLRPALLPSLLEVATYNNARQIKDLAFFETSDIYQRNNTTQKLGLLLSGRRLTRDEINPIPYDFFHLKGLLSALFTVLGLEPNRLKLADISIAQDIFHPARSQAILFDKKEIGHLGELHPSLLKEHKISPRTLYLEIDLSALLAAQGQATQFKPINRFPAVERDLAFIVDEQVSIGSIVQEMKKTETRILTQVRVFDVYQKVGEKNKSVALRLRFEDEQATLDDPKIKEAEDKIIARIKEKFQATLRDGLN